MGKKDFAQLKPDPVHQNLLAGKFINCLMHGGKKTTAQKIFYDALDIISKKIEGTEPIDVFIQAVNNVKPRVEVRSKRVGGANYQVPMPVNDKRQQSLAIRWILNACRSKSGKPMAQILANELGSAFNRDGEAIKKREDVHRMAEANKAFAHFAW
jgi:small subunit ribosomal protein S7